MLDKLKPLDPLATSRSTTGCDGAACTTGFRTNTRKQPDIRWATMKAAWRAARMLSTRASRRDCLPGKA